MDDLQYFKSQITAQTLSNFLVWYLYFDLVESPDSCGTWFSHVPWVDGHQWARLGRELAETLSFPSALTAACCELDINPLDVEDRLVRFATKGRMEFTEQADIVNGSRPNKLEELKGKLQRDHDLLQRLWPQEGTMWSDTWPKVNARIEEYVRFVVPALVEANGKLSIVAEVPAGLASDQTAHFYEMRHVFLSLNRRRMIPAESIAYGLYVEDDPSRTTEANTEEASETDLCAHLQLHSL